MVGRNPIPSFPPWAFFDGERPEASNGFTKLQNKGPVEEWFSDRGQAKAFLRTLTDSSRVPTGARHVRLSNPLLASPLFCLNSDSRELWSWASHLTSLSLRFAGKKTGLVENLR